jgi:hypothetical protein
MHHYLNNKKNIKAWLLKVGGETEQLHGEQMKLFSIEILQWGPGWA